NPGAGNGLDATLQGQPGETAFNQVFLYGIHGHATFHQSTDVAMELRRLLLLPVAKGEWGLPPGEYRIVDGMALQQHHEVSPGTSHGAGKPQDGVVLFLGGGSECLVDHLESFHGSYLVPMVRVLKASVA